MVLMPMNLIAQVLTRQIKNSDLNMIFKRHVEFNEKEVLLPLVDVAKALDEDKIDEIQGLPKRFGIACTVNYDLDNTGGWKEVEDGRVWKLRINSSDAKSLNLIFDKFHIPQGGEFIIYSFNKDILYGPVTHDDINNSNKLSTDIIKSNSIVIEYFEPASKLHDSEIHITKIIQGYKNFGDSGNCLDYNDINCSKGQTWLNESDAVAMVLIDQNQRWCSGTLLNNGCQDYTPSFLTAFHCIDINPANGVISDAERNEAQTWLFRFQYKSPTCNGPDDYDYVTISGSTFRSGWNPSDFALFELSQRPTGQKNIKLAGWNRADSAPSSTVGIHHPSGDVMKISFDNNASVIEGYYGGSGTTHYRVTWDDGVTEGGSSGSPLVDQNNRVVGQLHGGPSACNGDDLRDWYGRIFSSWNGGGSDINRLSTWLTNDPTVVTTNTVSIPYFTMSGSDFVICSSPHVGINLVNAPSAITHNINWSVTPNLTIVSQGSTSVLVRYSGAQNGAATITANIGNNNPGTVPGCKI